MDRYSERRNHGRLIYEAEIAHDLPARNKVYEGRLYNFSKGGLYFESDQSIFPGEEVFIIFKDNPETTGDEIMFQLPFGVKIVWHISRPDSFFQYGYGAHYIDKNDSLEKSIKLQESELMQLQAENSAAEKDPREHPRRNFHKSYRLCYRNQNYNGEVKNISKGGVYIKTDIKLKVGKPIRIAISRSKIRRKSYLTGLIVRINTDGFGVKFDS